MKLTVADYISQLTGDQVQVTTTESTAAKVQQPAVLKKAIQTVIDALDAGHIARYEITVKMRKGDPVNFHLDTNLINVPMAEAERLDNKLLDQEPTYPVNLYMVMESDDLNKSHLRIDELANETDLDGAIQPLVERAQTWVAEHLATVAEARAWFANRAIKCYSSNCDESRGLVATQMATIRHFDKWGTLTHRIVRYLVLLAMWTVPTNLR